MKVKPRRTDPKRVSWTHKTIFYELPYWKTLKQPYSLDVMHIEKNVFDNIIWTISLSVWFQKLCCRELKMDDVLKLKRDIVTILCKLEIIFPPAFFTVMVHLLVHLPDQVSLKGPVHYSWMYPIERQLGAYKKMIKNTRYPEGSIAEQYLVHECVGYCKLYLTNKDDPPQVDHHFDISVYSNLVKPSSFLRRTRLSIEEIDLAHWCVLQNCEEVRYFMDKHEERFYVEFPNGTNEDRIKQFPQYLLYWIDSLEGTDPMYSKSSPLYSLAYQPLGHSCYSKCQVNGINFVTWQRDQNRQTQNSGLMVDAGGLNYYGVLEDVIELKYNMDMPVVVFRCRWFNTYDPLENATLKTDRYGLISVDTSGSYYKDTPYCLATTARQVFYLDDPVLGDNWKIVQMVSHRGVYSDNALDRREVVYQELAPHTIPSQCLNDDFDINLGDLSNHGYAYYQEGDEDDEEVDDDEEADDDLEN